jgi:hypothetical protein
MIKKLRNQPNTPKWEQAEEKKNVKHQRAHALQHLEIKIKLLLL